MDGVQRELGVWCRMKVEATVAADILCDEEGFKPYVYKDHLGFQTIGHGILVDKRKGGGITEEESKYLLSNRVYTCAYALEKKFGKLWHNLTLPRQVVLVCMAYQLGVDGTMEFKKMILALERGDYVKAAEEMLDSKWAKIDTPARAGRMAEIMRSGRLFS